MIKIILKIIKINCIKIIILMLIINIKIKSLIISLKSNK
jgi:hypothetical protein